MTSVDDDKIIRIKKREYEKIKSGKYISLGSKAKVYSYNQNEIIKCFFKPIDDDLLERILLCLGRKNESFCFPKKLIYVDEDPVAYIANDSKGKPLFDAFYHAYISAFDIELKDLSHMYIDTIKDVREISEDCITMDDFHDGNITIGSNLRYIDTDDYYTELNEQRALESNAVSINTLFIRKFSELNSYVTKKVQSEVGKDYSNLWYLPHFLDAATMTLINQKDSSVKVRTLNDFKSYGY